MKNNFFAKFVRGKLFSLIFVAISFSLIFYMSERISRMIEMISTVSCNGIILCFLCIYFAYMFIYENSKKRIKKTHKLYALCCWILSLLINMTLCFIAADIIKFFFKVNEGIYWLALLVSLILSIYGMLHAKKIYIQKQSITIGSKKQLRVVFISDIHIGNFITVKQLDKIIVLVNSLKADMVLIAGDIFNDDTFEYFDLHQFAKQLKRLQPYHKIYAVLGNHDPNSSDERVYRFFEEAGIDLLVDEIRDLEDFYLVGRDDISNHSHRQPLDKLLYSIDRKKPIFLLDHNPVGLDEAVEQNVDLLLCGHTHRGQFFPANFFTKLAYGTLGFYGYHQKQKTHIIVSSGAGYFQIPMRIGTKSEIVLLDIKI